MQVGQSDKCEGQSRSSVGRNHKDGRVLHTKLTPLAIPPPSMNSSTTQAFDKASYATPLKATLCAWPIVAINLLRLDRHSCAKNFHV